jgi:FkbM family methyltransferase
MTVRTVLERLARGRILKRRLPGRFAPTELYVSPDAQLKYMKPGAEAFDADLLRIVDTQIREDSIVWDIGANVGVFAFAAASVARRGMTLAVEPDIWLTQLMRRSQRLGKNRALNVLVLPAAVSDRDGIATFMIARRGRASNALESVGGRTESGGARDMQTVPTLTLDTLLDCVAPPTFVKVDVEGAEALVLRGAQRLMRDVRPTIYVEVGREHSDELAKLLTAHDYALFDGAHVRNEARTPISTCAFNTLAVPAR